MQHLLCKMEVFRPCEGHQCRALLLEFELRIRGSNFEFEVRRSINATSEKLSPRSRSFGEVFVQFFCFRTFLKVFGCVWTCSDAFGCVRMQSDAFRCVGKRSKHFWKFSDFFDFSDDFNDFWSFGDLGGLLLRTFYV